MSNEHRGGVRSPLGSRRELTRGEVYRELKRAETIRSLSRAQLAADDAQSGLSDINRVDIRLKAETK